MTRPSTLRLPILRNLSLRRAILEIEMRLIVRVQSSEWKPVAFLLDTGSQFTTVSIDWAEALSIPFETAHPVQINGTTGSARGYLSTLTFSPATLEHYQFETPCCFSTSKLDRPLFCLTDLLRQFTLRTL